MLCEGNCHHHGFVQHWCCSGKVLFTWSHCFWWQGSHISRRPFLKSPRGSVPPPHLFPFCPTQDAAGLEHAWSVIRSKPAKLWKPHRPADLSLTEFASSPTLEGSIASTWKRKGPWGQVSFPTAVASDATGDLGAAVPWTGSALDLLNLPHSVRQL